MEIDPTPMRKQTSESVIAVVDSEYNGSRSYKCHGYEPPYDESTFMESIIVNNNEPLDVMLVNVNPSKGMDKFIILQLIKRNCSFEPVCLYVRFGDSGSLGCACPHITQTVNEGNGIRDFKRTFRSLTGLNWEMRNASAPISKRYCYVKQNMLEKRNGYQAAKWQYFVKNNTVGADANADADDGWNDIERELSSSNLEQLYQEYVMNPNLPNRTVIDSSGTQSFEISFDNMTRRNLTHSKSSDSSYVNIRRCPNGVKMDNLPPSVLWSVSGENSTAADNDNNDSLKILTESIPNEVQLKIYNTFLALRNCQYQFNVNKLSNWLQELNFLNFDGGPFCMTSNAFAKKVEFDVDDLPRDIRVSYDLYNLTVGTFMDFGSAWIERYIFYGFEEVGLLFLNVSNDGFGWTGYYDDKTYKCIYCCGDREAEKKSMEYVLDEFRLEDFQEDSDAGSKYEEMISEISERDAIREGDGYEQILFDEFTDLRSKIKT